MLHLLSVLLLVLPLPLPTTISTRCRRLLLVLLLLFFLVTVKYAMYFEKSNSYSNDVESCIQITYFSAHCISDHCTSNPNPNPNHDCSHLLVRDAVVRNAVGRKGDHHVFTVTSWKWNQVDLN